MGQGGAQLILGVDLGTHGPEVKSLWPRQVSVASVPNNLVQSPCLGCSSQDPPGPLPLHHR